MAQITESVCRGILNGQGYTDWEVKQLAHYWLHHQASNAVYMAERNQARDVVRQYREKNRELLEALKQVVGVTQAGSFASTIARAAIAKHEDKT